MVGCWRLLWGVLGHDYRDDYVKWCELGRGRDFDDWTGFTAYDKNIPWIIRR